RANLGIYFILIIYSIFFIGFTLNAGLDQMLGELLVLFMFMIVIMGGIIAFFILGQTVRRDVKVEEVKYFDIRPDRLSEVVLRLLNDDSISHNRDGPHEQSEDYWLDTFHLMGQSWEGISLEVERNPLIARVDLASVTVRGMSHSMEHLDKIKERIDTATMQELLDRYERDLGEGKPDLVIYGED
ncbi:MAG: hypothetical protein KAQ96_14470, partial [Thermoplasmata archaeon]|nr:hypothetical protein [Thermoplasmata archaeon]